MFEGRRSKKAAGAAHEGARLAPKDSSVANDDVNAPTDLSEVMRDERLINALLGDGEVETSSAEEFELATLLSEARFDVTATPATFELSEARISAALAAGAPARNGRPRRILTSVAASAASVALVLGGLAVVSANISGDSAPGESESRQVVSASMIRADLGEAQELLDQGEVQRGMALLNATTSRMAKLDRTAEFVELNNYRVQLWSRATGQPASAAPEVPTVPRDVPTQAPHGPASVPAVTPPPAAPTTTTTAPTPTQPVEPPTETQDPEPEDTTPPATPTTSVKPSATAKPPATTPASATASASATPSS